MDRAQNMLDFSSSNAILAFWDHNNLYGFKVFKLQYPHRVHKTHVGIFLFKCNTRIGVIITYMG
jgi:hypothetical protein